MRYWLSNNDGRTTGPYGLEEIRAFAGNGSLSPAAMACAEGSTEWQPISAVLTAPPTAPVTADAVMDGACGCCGTMPPRKPKELYGHVVCKKCYYRFANRRQCAYIIDVLCLWAVLLFVGIALGAMGATAGMPDEALEMIVTIVGWALFPVFPLVGHLIILVQMLKGPRLGDGWAHTKVIWKKHAGQPIFRPSGAPA